MDIKEGDYLALYKDKLLCADKDLNVLFNVLADKVKESGKSFVSIYYGEGVTEDEAHTVLNVFESKLGGTDAEITLYKGAQPVYYYIISAE
jgi:dihydroxyacetone kinase-like predicted kinase